MERIDVDQRDVKYLLPRSALLLISFLFYDLTFFNLNVIFFSHLMILDEIYLIFSQEYHIITALAYIWEREEMPVTNISSHPIIFFCPCKEVSSMFYLFLCPCIERSRAFCFTGVRLFVFLSVCQSVCPKLNITSYS